MFSPYIFTIFTVPTTNHPYTYSTYKLGVPTLNYIPCVMESTENIRKASKPQKINKIYIYSTKSISQDCG